MTIITELKQKMEKTIDYLNTELGTLRTGRAHPSLLDRITVNYYGTETPLSQMAAINVPESRLINIQPYDKSVIDAIEKAIVSSDLGLAPSNDGKIIRLNLPMLTEENRRDLTKIAKKMGEEAKVALRNERRNANDELKKAEKAKEITEDDLKGYEKDVQDVTDDFVKRVDDIVDAKMTDIMEV